MKPMVVVTATERMPVRTDLMKVVFKDLADITEIPLPSGNLSEAKLEPYWSIIEQADALFVRTGTIPARLIARCRRMRVITLHGAGVDQVDIAAARSAGILVTNLPGLNANAVAELTLGLMLALLRKLPLTDRLLRLGDWEAARTMGGELAGQTVGLIGFGNIGRRVAELLSGFPVRLLYSDGRGAFPEVPFESVPLEALLRQSDIVSLHVPLLSTTAGLINRNRLALMKPGALVINTSRGPIVDQSALYEALTSGRLAGAALDVFDPEPIRADDPLLRLDNVIVTPHIAGSTNECLVKLAQLGAQEILTALTGGRPRFIIS